MHRRTVLGAAVSAILSISPGMLALAAPSAAFAAGPPLSAGPLSSISSSSSLFYPTAMTSADFNGDGNEDVALTNYNSGTVTVMLGDGQGHFKQAPGSPISLSQGVGPIEAYQLGNDNSEDLVVGNTLSDQLTILVGNGDGTFTQQPPIQLSCNPTGIAIADFNSDTVPDIAVAEGCGQVQVFLGSPGALSPPGSPAFTEAPGSPISLPGGGSCGAGPTAIVTGVLDPSSGHNYYDLAVADGTNDQVDVLLNDGTGTFTEAPGSPFATGETNGCGGGFTTTNLEAMTAGDFNADGDSDDLAVGFGDGKASILIDGGSGTYQLASGDPVRIAPANTQIASLSTGSFSSNGREGIVAGDYWQGGCGCILYDADWVSVDETTGDGQLTPVTGSPFELGGVAGSVLAGSFAAGLGIYNATDDVVATDVNSCGGNAIVTMIGQGPAGGPTPPATVYPGDGCKIPPPSATTGPTQSV
ncbi:MAG: FG-GAP repeat domain-containing protein, partial [Solirubrobacteraceae bacterium]